MFRYQGVILLTISLLSKSKKVLFNSMSFKAVKIKKVSGSQVIRVPENMRIDDDRVYLKKIGNSLYIIPYHNPLESTIKSTNMFTEDYMKMRQQTEPESRKRF